jgi:hypothetical protein
MTDTTIATPAIRPFHIDDDDRVMLLSEWRQLRRMSKETELRLRKLGLGPQLVHLGPRRLGVTAWSLVKAAAPSATSMMF